MEFSEAKELMKSAYIEFGFELADEHEKELYFSLSGGRIIRLSEEEISNFLEVQNSRETFEIMPTECSICSNDYLEQLVDFSYMDRSRRAMIMRDRVFRFGYQNDDLLYVEIGEVSEYFMNYFRFSEPFSQFIHRRFQYSRPGERNEPVLLDELLFRPITIRVHNINAQTIDRAIKRSTPIIDSCLFMLSYMRNISLRVEEEWPYRYSRVRPFHFGEGFSGNEFPLADVSFNPDIVRFYLRGMSTQDPVIQYLSFYQVLEYFFITVSDDQLYRKLSRRLNDPMFTPTPTKLDQIVLDTITHKRETDETEMLKLVLKEFIDENELIEFINEYENYLDDNLYTKRRKFFGETSEVKLETGHVIGNLAKRVKIIRNALVHSSDRYERKQRYIPTASAESKIRKEIPLMKYLAERVIIASAS